MATVVYLKIPVRVLNRVENNIVVGANDTLEQDESGVKITLANGDTIYVPWGNVGTVYTSSRIGEKVERT